MNVTVLPPESVSQKSPQSQDATRTQLLETAIRLYAEHGLDAVSMRQIGAEAGARNSSAVHYHFGDKLGLLDAILTHIAGALAAVRAREYPQSARNLNELITQEVMVWGYLTIVPGWGMSGVKLLSRLLLEFSPDLRACLHRHFGAEVLQFRRQLAAYLPQLSRERLSVRTLLAYDSIIHGTAEYDVLQAMPFEDTSELTLEVTRAELIAYVVQGLSAS